MKTSLQISAAFMLVLALTALAVGAGLSLAGAI